MNSPKPIKKGFVYKVDLAFKVNHVNIMFDNKKNKYFIVCVETMYFELKPLVHKAAESCFFLRLSNE